MRELEALQRYILIRKARAGCYRSFVHLMHPDESNGAATRYDFQKLHLTMIDYVQQVIDGNIRNLVLTVPPRAGKTELCSRLLISYLLGRYADAECILGTYGAGLATELSKDVATIMGSAAFKQVFPDREVKVANAEAIRMADGRGRCAFAGRGTALTGKGGGNGGVIVIDDLFKDSKEADSLTIRDSAWNWYNKVVMSRRINDRTPTIIISTRWHEDDIVGRLTDPNSMYYNKGFANNFTYVNIPVLCDDELTDPLGRKQGESSWPSRFTSAYLQEVRAQDPRGFSALYMGKPSPEDGTYFKAENIHGYTQAHKPPMDAMTIYASSDFAISTKQTADYTVHLVYGVDKEQTIWVLDMIRKRCDANIIVEDMLHLMRKYKPVLWYAERGHISKSIAPYLRARMKETNTYCAVRSIQPAGDKATRARSIQGRFNMGMVRLPVWAVWFEAMRSELLSFGGGGAHDDIVDAFSMAGLGLDSTHGSAKTVQKPVLTLPSNVKKVVGMTMGELKAQTKQIERNNIIQFNRRKF